MKKSIGLDEMITSLDQVKSKLSYYIDKSQRDMLELEGYSPREIQQVTEERLNMQDFGRL